MMKRIFGWILALALLLCSLVSCDFFKKDTEVTDEETETETPEALPPVIYDIETQNDAFRAMTFNVSAESFTEDRGEKVVETIVKYLPDAIGLQECSADWREYLMAHLGAYYGYVGVGRDANGTGLATAILYAKEKLTVKDSATKWLSATPDEVSKL